ncbi:probable BOI-related E3 ubiquitin-protein ligase 2 [Typha angustifolia]|uniref:probable BOI-related E3 ubiquitin-protein ligase 2 n=1 Tax=Typha angustifolia TaxID=59011 RepID=UPI003C2EA424
MAFVPHRNQQPQQLLRNFSLADGQISSSVALFNQGQSLANFWEPVKKRPREQEFFHVDNGNQVAAVDYLRSWPPASTGLELSLDALPHVASSTSVLDSPLSLRLPMRDDEVGREIQRQEAEMERFFKIQSERMRKEILEKIQAEQLQILTSVEDRILHKIREKDTEVADISKKNMELEQQMKHLSVEVGAWQQRALYNENMIATLKVNLQQVVDQGKDNKEGSGDSEVDDAASFCNGGAVALQLLSEENKEMKDTLACKACGINEVCMLLLPCRHLCLCKECEFKLSFCPLCHSSKLVGMEIYM